MIKKLLTTVLVASALLAHAQTGITNLDFEYWTGSVPTGFFGFGGISQQTTGAQSGSYYVRISVTTPSGPTADGIMILGTPPATLGAPYTLRPYGISGYYRCSFAGPDTMALASGLMLNPSDVAPLGFLGIFQAQASWTQFSLLFNYANASNPDSIALIFYANTHFINNSDNTVGSYLDLDNLSIDMTGGVVPYADAFTHISLYPNPASGTIYISARGTETQYAAVYDIAGRFIRSYEMNAGSLSIDVSSYAPGIYQYCLKDKNGAALSSAKFIVAR